MGNYTGYDDVTGVNAALDEEELRKKREEELRRQQEEAARNQPVTQKITYNPDGTQKMTITGTPQALSAGQPNTPTVSGPVNPDDVFRRMQQVESGNRDFDAQGRPITSSAGAMYRNQVMPATAANPGFGIRPAANQSPEEYNRVGEEYAKAMQQRYPNNQQAQVAAYNMGPGAVDRNIKQNNGQFNLAQAPRETQGYVPQVLGQILNAVVPSAQAGTVPQNRMQAAPTITPVSAPAQPVAPGAAELTAAQGNAEKLNAIANGPYPDNVKVAAQAQLQQLSRPPAPAAAPAPASQGAVQIDDQGNRLITTPTGETFALGPDNRPLPARGVAVEQMGAFGQDFIQNQKNPQGLLAIADDNSGKYTPFERKLAKDQVFETMRNQRLSEQAQDLITKAKDSGDGRALAKILQDRSEGVTVGRVAQAFLFNLIGFQSGAKDVVNKMGINDTWERVVDPAGNTAIIRKSPDGLPVSGITADGKEIPTKDLVNYLGQGVSKLKPDVSMQDVEKGNMKGRVVTTYDINNRPTTRVESNGKFYDYDSSWKPVSIGVAGAKAEATKAVELRYTGPIAYTKAGADFAGEFNTKYNTNIGYQSQQPGAPLVDLNTGQPIVPNSNGTITATQNTGGTATGNKSAADIQGEFEANKKIREQQAKNANEAKKVFPFVDQIKNLVDQSTGSGIGSLVDKAGNWFGYSTEGAKAIAAIKPLANKILMSVERFEGPQSDKDVKAYQDAAGALADPTVPADQKQAAFATIIEIMKRNAPDLDWSKYESAEKKSEIMNKADEILNKGKKK